MNVTKLDDFYDNKPQIAQLKELIRSERTVSCLIYGETGCGKSTMLRLLQEEFQSTRYAVVCDGQSMSKIEDIKNGLDTPYTVEDYFKGCVSKRPVMYVDNVDSWGFSKGFFKKPHVLVIATTDLECFRQQKDRFSVVIKLDKPSFRNFSSFLNGVMDQKIKSKETREICANHSSDIRGLLQQMSLDGEVTVDKSERGMLRDPSLDTISCLEKVLSIYKSTGKFNSVCCNMVESDKYNSLFLLYENYLSWIPKDDTFVEIPDIFSSFDIQGIDYSSDDFLTHGTTLSALAKCSKISRKYRPSKLISRKNQTVINSNRFNVARRKYLPSGCKTDLYYIARIYGDTDKNLIWINKMYK